MFLGVESSKASELVGYDGSINGNRTNSHNRRAGVLRQLDHKEYSVRAPVGEKLVRLLYSRSMATRESGASGTFRTIVTSCCFPFDIVV